MRTVLTEAGLAVDYAAVVDAATLEPLARLDRPARALLAARVASVRLIDNAPLLPESCGRLRCIEPGLPTVLPSPWRFPL